jgi:fumarate hydratase class II
VITSPENPNSAAATPAAAPSAALTAQIVTVDGIDYRVEHDTMGDVLVPISALYSAQTQRAVENFPISGQGLESAQIAALARIKKAAALANKELGVLDGTIADAIVVAADLVITGIHDAQFPVDTYQTGSGTSSNMNMNEVLATLATEHLRSTQPSAGQPGSNQPRVEVHPNDHVNASQSSNDVFPTSVHVAVTQALLEDLVPALDHLAKAFESKAVLWKDAVKSGRTHLMDATPVTLGQEFGGYARQMRLGIERVAATIPRVAEVPLGGTAVGTGINTPNGFPQKVIAILAAETGLPIVEAADHFEAQANRDGLVEASGALRSIAVSLTKINNDLRWMGSGPNTGLGELHIPDLQPGSSIMPGKVNPVVPEAVLMVAARVIGNDATVAWAGASGSFELNVAIPVMGTALLESIRLLANASRVLADKTVDGLEANLERAAAFAGMSPAIVTPLNKVIGYEAAAKIAKHAVAAGITVREAVIALGYVERGEITIEVLDQKLDLISMTRPG